MTDKEIPHGKPDKRGWERIVCAARYSKDGFQAACRHEAAFRQLLVLHGALLVWMWCLDLETAVRMMLLAASFVSLIAELFNTAVEAVVDYISLEHHPLAKRAKDVGSAAQFAALLMTAALWAMALLS